LYFVFSFPPGTFFPEIFKFAAHADHVSDQNSVFGRTTQILRCKKAIDENDQSNYVGPNLGKSKELRNFHSKAKDLTQKPCLKWAEDEQRYYKQALDYIRVYIV
jgi:hypothetical protein